MLFACPEVSPILRNSSVCIEQPLTYNTPLRRRCSRSACPYQNDRNMQRVFAQDFVSGRPSAGKTKKHGMEAIHSKWACQLFLTYNNM